ncbi:MAG: DUF465 domain-containing protein [Pseudomonadota bacterium]
MQGDDLSAAELEAKLEALREEHRRLDTQIDALQLQGVDAFQIMSLKRQKLKIRDEMAWVAAQLTPDIIA